MEEPAGNTYFFEQTTYRKATKRYKKTPDELPQDLRFAHLNPKVAAYLANKEKEQKVLDGEFDDGLGSKSLLPQINQTVSLIKQRLDTLLNNDGDPQRYQFEEAKLNAESVLTQLSKILYLFEGLHPHIPKSLEYYLVSSYQDLAVNAQYMPREWQLLSNKEEYLNKTIMSSDLTSKDTITDAGQTARSDGGTTTGRSEMGFDDTCSVKDDGKQSRLVKGKMTSRTNVSVLGDITETEEQSLKDGATSSSKVDGPPSILAGKKGGETKDKIGANPKAKSRLEKYKSGTNLDTQRPMSSKSRTGSVFGARLTRAGTKDDIENEPAEGGKILSGGAKDTGYYAVIQFQLSNKACEDKGWVCQPQDGTDPARETVFKWATERLQLSIKQSAEDAELDKEMGYERPVLIRFYGDSRKDQIDKYKRQSTSGNLIVNKTAPVWKGEKPKIPSIDYSRPGTRGKPLFLVTHADGSTTIYYQNGKPAIVMSRAGPNLPGYYTLVYDPEQRMQASFTPTGQGCIYHNNGIVKFLMNNKEATLAETDGTILRRWTWPPCHGKLPGTITVQVNSMITFKCVNHQTAHLHVHIQKETAKVHVGIVTSNPESPAREDLGTLLTTCEFTSQAAREFSKPYKPRAQKKAKPPRGKVGVKVRIAEPKWTSKQHLVDLKNSLDMPEPTLNDADADKMLLKLQRKIKNLAEDWLEHYRIACSISNPAIRMLGDQPARRARNIKSAKPSVGRLVIEPLSTQVPRASPSLRVPSAPAGRAYENRPDDGGMDARNSQVKFDDNVDEYEDSILRNTPYPASIGSAGSGRSSRARSAPQRLTSLHDTNTSQQNITLCPVAIRMLLLGEERVTCRCSRHKIPTVTDLEFDDFVLKFAPNNQLIVMSVMSSLFEEAQHAHDMLEKLHSDKNRNRTRPCLQSRSDPVRIFHYDIATAAEFSDKSTPLLLRRHNVIPGMFLIYQGGNLVFCDHIFNGYGNALKDFQKQMAESKRNAEMKRYLPKDFKFSPMKGRHGARAAWGGEIGGAGIDRHGNTGLVQLDKRASLTSLSSGESNDVPIDYHLSGVRCSAKYFSAKISSAGYPRLQSSQSNLESSSLPKVKLAKHRVSIKMPDKNTHVIST